MGRLELSRVLLGCFIRPSHLCAAKYCCMCMTSTLDDQDGFEGKALITRRSDEMVKLKEMYEGSKTTLAFHLQPKTVVLRVSMHCQGCAKQVGKRISRIVGVTSFEVDLDSKKVVVVGDITPFEVLACISKIKSAELWVEEEPEIVSISNILS